MTQDANFAESNIKSFLKFARLIDRRQILLLISEIKKTIGISKNRWHLKKKPVGDILIFEKKPAVEMNTKWNKNFYLKKDQIPVILDCCLLLTQHDK